MSSEILKTIPEARLEVEFNALVHMVVSNRERLKEILNRYGVAKPEDIKARIASGELKAHPAFEDYLSALALQIDTEDMLKMLQKKINELREST
jgi:(p)ppGpp synthase/HD superfamily hydrolase